MSRWVEVGKLADFRPGEGRTVVAGDLRLALFNDNGQLFAIDDTCPHQGASLGEGLLHEGRVICPWHSWVFELRTGRCPRETHESIQTYATRCGQGTVEVEIPAGERRVE